MHIGRREWILRSLCGAGSLGLRSLASGIPIAWLANPRAALAAPTLSCGTGTAQYLIWSNSADGDPMGNNVPGTYIDDPAVMHPSGPDMAATACTLGSQHTVGARPWANLPQPVLDRTCFFHHATGTVVHSENLKVNQLMGAVRQNDVFISLLAAALAPCLGTVQTAPVTLATSTGAGFPFQGTPQPALTPQSLSLVLGQPQGPLSKLQQLRDQDVDSLNKIFRKQATAGQRAFLDQYVQSQAQARNLSLDLLSELATITDNSPTAQLKAAVILCRMKVAPVIAVSIPFGGDNHSDPGLQSEINGTLAGVGAIAAAQEQLTVAKMQDNVTFACLNVFGRTFGQAAGRNHNSNHHCTVMIGKKLQGGVVGGIGPTGGDYGALPLQPTGVGNPSGTIAASDTLAAMAKTLAAAVGVDDAHVDANISGGQRIASALR